MNGTNPLLRTVGVASLAITIVACDDSTGVEGPNEEMVLDAAIIAADATVEVVRMWSQSLGFGLMPTSPEYDTTPGNFAAAGRPGGHGSWAGKSSGTREKTCFDELRKEQTECDPLTTASMHIVRAIAGTIDRDKFTAEIARERDMTVTGMLGEETHRTWDGVGTSHTSRAGVLADGSERSHESRGAFTFTEVVTPMARSAFTSWEETASTQGSAAPTSALRQRRAAAASGACACACSAMITGTHFGFKLILSGLEKSFNKAARWRIFRRSMQ